MAVGSGWQAGRRGLNTSLIKDKTCEQSGNMGWPAFTADGSLYFAGSAATRGVRSVDRADQDHTIFRADMERGLLEKAATGFSNVTALSASDDGSVIAVAGRRQNKKGLHILRPHTGQVCYRSYSELTQATLTPDGRRVAVVQDMGDSGNRTLSISIENLGSESRTSI